MSLSTYMKNIMRKIVGLACVALAGCAVGSSSEDDPFTGLEDQSAKVSPPNAESSAFDAGPVGALGGETSTTGAFNASLERLDAGFSGLPSPVDSGTTVRAEAGTDSGGSDAGAAARDADARTGGSDAGANVSDASSGTSGGGSTCNPLACNNDCFLLARCCNADNQCACLSPLTLQCSLPSL